MQLLTLVITKTEEDTFVAKLTALNDFHCTSPPFTDLSNAILSSAASLRNIGNGLAMLRTISNALGELSAEAEVQNIISKLKEPKDAN